MSTYLGRHIAAAESFDRAMRGVRAALIAASLTAEEFADAVDRLTDAWTRPTLEGHRWNPASMIAARS